MFDTLIHQTGRNGRMWRHLLAFDMREPIDDPRYLVHLFRTQAFEAAMTSSIDAILPHAAQTPNIHIVAATGNPPLGSGDIIRESAGVAGSSRAVDHSERLPASRRTMPLSPGAGADAWRQSLIGRRRLTPGAHGSPLRCQEIVWRGRAQSAPSSFLRSSGDNICLGRRPPTVKDHTADARRHRV